MWKRNNEKELYEYCIGSFIANAMKNEGSKRKAFMKAALSFVKRYAG